jgi:hypothetical protein
VLSSLELRYDIKGRGGNRKISSGYIEWQAFRIGIEQGRGFLYYDLKKKARSVKDVINFFI